MANTLVINNNTATMYEIESKRAKNEIDSIVIKEIAFAPEDLTEKIIKPLTKRTTE